MEKNPNELEAKNREKLREVFKYAYEEKPREGYVPLSDEELMDIYLENFGGQI